MLRNCMVFLIPVRRELTCQFVESCVLLHQLADHVSSQSKRKTTQFQGIFVWIIILFFLNIILGNYAFYNKRFQMLFIDQRPIQGIAL